MIEVWTCFKLNGCIDQSLIPVILKIHKSNWTIQLQALSSQIVAYFLNISQHIKHINDLELIQSVEPAFGNCKWNFQSKEVLQVIFIRLRSQNKFIREMAKSLDNSKINSFVKEGIHCEAQQQTWKDRGTQL